MTDTICGFTYRSADGGSELVCTKEQGHHFGHYADGWRTVSGMVPATGERWTIHTHPTAQRVNGKEVEAKCFRNHDGE